MRKIRQTLLGLAVICLIVGFGGIVPVSAGSYSDTIKVSIPYTQVYDADSTRTNDTFTYQVKPVGGAPAPAGSDANGIYQFSVKAKPKKVVVQGAVDLNIVFPRPGRYDYEIKAIGPKNVEGIKLDSTVYTAHIYVKNASGGLAVSRTITAGKKWDALEFYPSYSHSGQVTRPISTPEDDDSSTGKKKTVRAAAGNTGNGGGGGGGAGGNAVAADNAVPEPTTAPVEEPFAEPEEYIAPQVEEEVGTWALLNLLLAIANILFAIILAIRYFGRIDTDEDEYIIRRGGKWRLAGIVLAVAAIVTFLLTETIVGNEVVLTDEWTPFMALLTALAIALGIFTYKHYGAGNGEQKEGA